MKVHGIKREWSSPIFCLKTHYCPYCNERLGKTKAQTIIHSASEEAKKNDFSYAGGDNYLVGNEKFIRTVFRCNKCGKTYSIEELKKAEKASNK